jgi:hypothetical protein
MLLDHQSLKKRQRAERENHPPNLALRVHRALSWLDRAERCEDQDGRFIFLWIAFNAAYANEIGDRERAPELQVFEGFLQKLVDLDRDQLRDCNAFLGKLVPFVILLMLDNPNVLWGDACYPVVAS